MFKSVGKVAPVIKCECDVFLKHCELLRITCLTMLFQVKTQCLLVIVKCLNGCRRSERLLTRLYHVLLSLGFILTAAVMIGKHAVKFMESFFKNVLNGIRNSQVEFFSFLRQNRLICRFLCKSMFEKILHLLHPFSLLDELYVS